MMLSDTLLELPGIIHHTHHTNQSQEYEDYLASSFDPLIQAQKIVNDSQNNDLSTSIAKLSFNIDHLNKHIKSQV